MKRSNKIYLGKIVILYGRLFLWMHVSFLLFYVLPFFDLRVRFYFVVSHHFHVDMNINYMIIFINLLFAKVRIILNTKDFLIPEINNLSRI